MEISVVNLAGEDSTAVENTGAKLYTVFNVCGAEELLPKRLLEACGARATAVDADIDRAHHVTFGESDGDLSEAFAESLVDGALMCEQKCFRNPWSADMMSEHIAAVGGIIFAAVVGGEVCGYISAKLLPSAGEGEVYRVAVLPQFRRRGVAELMLRSVIKIATESSIDRLFIEVRVGNMPARACYEKLGWKQIAMRKKYYHDPDEDAVIMELVVG